MKTSRRVGVGVALVAVAFLAAACSTKPAASKASTTTLPPLPPDLIAFVTEIGAGSALGSGTSVAGIDVTEGIGGTRHTFGVGTFPDAIAVTPDGKYAYVANYASNDVTPINLTTGSVGRAIPAGPGPAGIAITPDGKTAYVTDAGTSPIGTTVTPIDLATGRAGAPITVGAGPQGIAITPDGKFAFVADAGAIVTGQTGPVGSTVTPIELATGKALPPITVGNAPLAVAVSPDGSTVWVTNSSSGSVSPITVANRSAGAAIAVSGSPQALAVSSDGSTVWVADASSGVAKTSNVTAISTTSGTASTPITVCKAPTGIALAPGGQTAWLACFGQDTIEPVNLSTRHANASGAISVSGGPYAIALVSEAHADAMRTLGASTSKKKTKK